MFLSDDNERKVGVVREGLRGKGAHGSGSFGLSPAYGATSMIRQTLSYIKMPLTLPGVE